jgi:hypothetical protein
MERGALCIGDQFALEFISNYSEHVVGFVCARKLDAKVFCEFT